MQHYWSGQMPPHYYCWWYSTNFGYYNNVWSPRVQAIVTCFEFVWKRAGFLFDSMRLRQNQSQLLTHLLENGFGKNLHLVDMWAWKFSGFDVGNLSKFYCKQFLVSFPEKVDIFLMSFLNRLMRTTFKTFSSWIAEETLASFKIGHMSIIELLLLRFKSLTMTIMCCSRNKIEHWWAKKRVFLKRRTISVV